MHASVRLFLRRRRTSSDKAADRRRTLMPCLRKTPSGGRMMARMRRTKVTVLSSAIAAAAGCYQGGDRRHRRSFCWARRVEEPGVGKGRAEARTDKTGTPFRSGARLCPLVFVLPSFIQKISTPSIPKKNLTFKTRLW